VSEQPHDDVTGEGRGFAAGSTARASGTHLAAMVESAMDGIITVDAQQRIVLFNEAAQRMFRCSDSQALGKPLENFIPTRFRRAHGAHLQSFGETGVTQRRMGQLGPISGLRADGEEFPIEASISQATVDGNKLFTVILRDVTERMQAEQKLSEQRQTLAAIIEAASDAIVSTDESGSITLFNPAAERIFGVAADAMIGQPLDRLMPERYRARHGGDLRGFMASRVTRRAMGAGHVKGINAQGEELELEASISQAVVHGRVTLTAILRDVTPRIRAETELLRYQYELSQLAHQLMLQEKDTTRRLAQSLHDQLGQTLTALRLAFDLLTVSVPAQSREQAKRIDEMIARAISEVRGVLVDLRPPLLDDSGLAAALDNELRTRQPHAQGIAIGLAVPGELRAVRWPADVEYAVFMVAREAVNNAICHAGGSALRVALDGDANHLDLRVTDNGAGLPGEQNRLRPGHLGMVGMRERALAINATFSAIAADGGGTTIRLQWSASQ
jgi:PAS domain S-box-containing protein